MDIPNYPNYWIDPCGNVYSKTWKRFKKMFMIKMAIYILGYQKVIKINGLKFID